MVLCSYIHNHHFNVSNYYSFLHLKKTYYHLLWKLVRIWSKLLIYGMGFRLNIQLDQEIEPNKSYMFCPNHASSLMDPFVLIVLSKNPIVFVGKQELG